eukprot:TRINITY_DN19343_c0_g1_i1.p1 TRINITY_DN19343_c0_g1~~TRINITY_DN19343_c0_g1_i1.p1  ORF type:complete len:251 (+),score=93.54 TRINITY_DN19343_c0_g1_i1:78-830(+)
MDQQFANLSSKTVDEQTKFFLRAFVMDFQGKFEPVLDICEQFKNYAPAGTERAQVKALPEFECHLFLEKRNETLTVKALRENLKSEIRLTSDHNVAFIEYLLYKYKKTVKQLFTPPPEGAVPKHVLEALDKAISAYLATKEKERQRLAELESLKSQSESNAGKKPSVASVAADNKIHELKGAEFGNAFAQLEAKRKKREAEEAAAKAEKVDPYVEEQKRLEEERKRKEEEKKKAADESKARLKAKASLWK